MPSLATTVTARTEEQIVLKPTVRRRLLVELKEYQSLKVQVRTLELEMDKHKGKIEELRDETGYQTVALEGFTVTLVCPIRTSLDKMKLMAAGVTQAQLEEGTVSKPTKPYTKVSLPGEPVREY